MENLKIILNRLGRQIIRKNEYLSLATVNNQGKPWLAIVAYAYDSDWNMYFASILTSKHGQNIANNPTVVCSIFDSHQDWGHGVGLQISAKCKILPKIEFDKASKSYFGRKYPYGVIEAKTKKYFKKELENADGKYKFYKIIPTVVWINNPHSKEDERVKINLNANF